MTEGFPLSDTISFKTSEGWYDLIITTADIPAGFEDNPDAIYQTVADLHAPHEAGGEATLLEALTQRYADEVSARAGHAETIKRVEERMVALPLPNEVQSIRKLRA